jgi:uncharacterized protein
MEALHHAVPRPVYTCTLPGTRFRVGTCGVMGAMPRSLALGAVGFGIVALACGTKNVGSVIRPASPTARVALGESGESGVGGTGTVCREDGPAEPLIVDWRSHERQDLELAMREGIAIVAYDCKSIRLLPDCHVASPVAPAYTFAGVTITEDSVQLKTSDELAANLPLSAAHISAEMKTGSSIDLAIVTIGKLAAPVPHATRADLIGGSPACDGATHYVRSAMIGAFAMQTGTAGHVRAAAEIFGTSEGAASSSEKLTSNTGGVRADCSAAKPDDTSPAGQCRAASRITIIPITPEGSADRGADMGASSGGSIARATEAVRSVACPPGLVWTGTLCATPGADVAHACKGDDLAECSAQCDKKNGESCYRAARLKLLHAAGDADKLDALGFDMKGCDDLYGPACRGLGYIFELACTEELDPVRQAEDASSALSYYEKACNFGDGEACQHAADCYEDGRLGAEDTGKTVKLTTRGCDLGFARSCTELWAMRVEGRYGVSQEAQAGIERLRTACSQPNGGAYCVLLGDYYRSGRVVPKDDARALEAYERGCSRYSTNACGKKGEMIAQGEGTPPDFDQAKTYLRRGCPELDWGGSSGDPDACLFMSRAYEAGTFGFAKDPLHALEIDEERCKRWPGSALCAMAGAEYEQGLVVKRDLDRAMALYRRGCDLGTGDGAACIRAASAAAREDPKLGIAMYRRACLAGKDAASCMTVGGLLAQDAVERATANTKSFYRLACKDTQLARICAKSAALGNPAPSVPPALGR